MKSQEIKRGQNIKVWDLPTNDRRSFDRAFRFFKVRPGIYQISNLLSSKSRLDIAGARSKKMVQLLVFGIEIIIEMLNNSVSPTEEMVDGSSIQ